MADKAKSISILLPKYTWVTFINNERYLDGARVLAKSLEKSGSKYKLIILIPHDFNISNNFNSLNTNVAISNIEISNIEYVPIKLLVYQNDEVAMKARDEYSYCMNKIYAWTLTAYDKVCWLDSDMIILKNIDDVFKYDIRDGEIGAAHGCTCNIFKNNKLPTHIDRCPFNNLKGTYINTGLILLKPNVATYKLLLNIDYNYPLPDQDAFNEFFKNNIIHIDSKYNYINNLEFAHPEYRPDIHIFHFTYGKPWEAEAIRISDTFKYIYDLWFEYKNLLT